MTLEEEKAVEKVIREILMECREIKEENDILRHKNSELVLKMIRLGMNGGGNA